MCLIRGTKTTAYTRLLSLARDKAKTNNNLLNKCRFLFQSETVRTDRGGDTINHKLYSAQVDNKLVIKTCALRTSTSAVYAAV